MQEYKEFLVITHIPFENCICDYFDTEIEAINYINSDDGYCHDLIEIKSYRYFYFNDYKIL